ncbi:hypothetical protein GUJ93_ZPchr0010g7748 [Zizania palustris]|uniref:Uncharacterized protein n=1 Tax=Zizania palustris TaxID=103762 RepID=A0A8J6BK68_ZIZPA|nr:hypothetical protein GUJ93_ZPchr0010g7748 [Zizania palustris]
MKDSSLIFSLHSGPYNPFAKLQLGMWWLQDEESGFLVDDVAKELIMSVLNENSSESECISRASKFPIAKLFNLHLADNNALQLSNG